MPWLVVSAATTASARAWDRRMLSSTGPVESVWPTTHSSSDGSAWRSFATSSRAGADSGLRTDWPESKKTPSTAAWPVARRSLPKLAASAVTCWSSACCSTTTSQILPLPFCASNQTSRPSTATWPLTQRCGSEAATVPPMLRMAFS